MDKQFIQDWIEDIKHLIPEQINQMREELEKDSNKIYENNIEFIIRDDYSACKDIDEIQEHLIRLGCSCTIEYIISVINSYDRSDIWFEESENKLCVV